MQDDHIISQSDLSKAMACRPGATDGPQVAALVRKHRQLRKSATVPPAAADPVTVGTYVKPWDMLW